jgi:hypothetical protein
MEFSSYIWKQLIKNDEHYIWYQPLVTAMFCNNRHNIKNINSVLFYCVTNCGIFDIYLFILIYLYFQNCPTGVSILYYIWWICSESKSHKKTSPIRAKWILKHITSSTPPLLFLLKYMYQARKVSNHVFVLGK